MASWLLLIEVSLLIKNLSHRNTHLTINPFPITPQGRRCLHVLRFESENTIDDNKSVRVQGSPASRHLTTTPLLRIDIEDRFSSIGCARWICCLWLVANTGAIGQRFIRNAGKTQDLGLHHCHHIQSHHYVARKFRGSVATDEYQWQGRSLQRPSRDRDQEVEHFFQCIGYIQWGNSLRFHS